MDNQTSSKECKLVKRFIGFILFAIFFLFGRVFSFFPLYFTLPLASVYFFIQFRLWLT